MNEEGREGVRKWERERGRREREGRWGERRREAWRINNRSASISHSPHDNLVIILTPDPEAVSVPRGYVTYYMHLWKAINSYNIAADITITQTQLCTIEVEILKQSDWIFTVSSLLYIMKYWVADGLVPSRGLVQQPIELRQAKTTPERGQSGSAVTTSSCGRRSSCSSTPHGNPVLPALYRNRRYKCMRVNNCNHSRGGG